MKDNFHKDTDTEMPVRLHLNGKRCDKNTASSPQTKWKTKNFRKKRKR